MKFNREYFIHYYDADLTRKVTITSLMKYFEDIAILQSESIGLGLDYYQKNSVAWLLYKWDISINEYPVYKDLINVITEPIGASRFYAYRSFEVKNKLGESIVTANSMWIYIDTISRRPGKIPEEIYAGYGMPLQLKRELPIDEPKSPSRIDSEKYFNIRLSDIDTNNHVNNIKYIEWALEAVPAEIIGNYTLKRLKVIYKKETNYGRRIKSVSDVYIDEENVTIKHKILDDEIELYLLETNWKK